MKSYRLHSACRGVVAPCVLALGVLVFQTSCVTKDNYTPLSPVRSKIGFDDKFLKERGIEGDDSDKIMSKFANAGFKKNDDGEMVAKNRDLYSDKTVGRGRDQKKEDFYLSKRDVENKYFKKPEYLKRQQYKTESAREQDSGAREGLFDSNRAQEAGKTANTKAKPGFLAGLNPFKTDSARESEKAFATRQDTIGTRARENAPTATGVRQAEMGFYTDTVNTMDDVKKLLHPEQFD